MAGSTLTAVGIGSRSFVDPSSVVPSPVVLSPPAVEFVELPSVVFDPSVTFAVESSDAVPLSVAFSSSRDWPLGEYGSRADSRS